MINKHDRVCVLACNDEYSNVSVFTCLDQVPTTMIMHANFLKRNKICGLLVMRITCCYYYHFWQCGNLGHTHI